MIKRAAATIAALFLLTGLACAQFAQNVGAQPGAPPNSQILAPAPGPAIGAGQVGVPTYVVPPSGGGIVDIGQALGPFLQPYVNALVGALLSALVGWLGVQANKWLGVKLDEGARNALTTALQNQVGSLIADGFVKLDGAKINVNSEQLAQSANEVMAVIPDAAKRLGFTPDYVAKRIVDTIPQTAAGAAMIAPTAAATTPATPKAA